MPRGGSAGDTSQTDTPRFQKPFGPSGMALTIWAILNSTQIRTLSYHKNDRLKNFVTNVVFISDSNSENSNVKAEKSSNHFMDRPKNEFNRFLVICQYLTFS